MSDDFRTRSRNAWADAVKGWEPMPQEGAAPSPALTREALAAALKANVECTSNGIWYDVDAILAALAGDKAEAPR